MHHTTVIFHIHNDDYLFCVLLCSIVDYLFVNYLFFLIVYFSMFVLLFHCC